MHDVFISYTREDGDAASAIARQLSAEGLTVFFDREALVAGESFSDRITNELKDAAAVIVLLSANSKRSSWVAEELSSALKGRKLVVPVLLDEAARNNWIWPLVSDRQAIQIDMRSPEWELQVSRLAQELTRAIAPDRAKNVSADIRSSATPHTHEDRMASAATKSIWISVAIAIASAALGGLVVWWLR